MKQRSPIRVVYCGKPDSLFKKLLRHAEGLVLESSGPHLQHSPQKLARDKKASALILRVRKDLDQKHQEWLSRNDASVPVFVFCQNGTVETAIHAFRYGVFDYFCLNQGWDRMIHRVHEALLQGKPKPIRSSFEVSTDVLLHGSHPEILSINRKAGQLARESSSVVLIGEIGTGKEHLARGIHSLSAPHSGVFLSYDCRLLQHVARYESIALPELLQKKVQSESRTSPAVVFLNHFEYLSAEHKQHILGKWSRSPTRVIASYREPDSSLLTDEYVPSSSLRLPPLRSRREDIRLLSHHFMAKLSKEKGIRPKPITEEAYLLMRSYVWPGNLQELKNTMERMLTMEPYGVITSRTWNLCKGAEILWNLKGGNQLATLITQVLTSMEPRWEEGKLYEGFIEQMETMLINLILPQVNYNQATAARILGISRNTLRRRLKSA